MCGLVAMEGKTAKRDIFLKALETLVHRGPDHLSVIERPEVILGFQRLSIMDLTGHGNRQSHSGDR